MTDEETLRLNFGVYGEYTASLTPETSRLIQVRDPV